MRGSLRGEREWGGSSSSSSSGWIGESVWGGTHTLSRWGYPLTGARRHGPWRLAPLPRQQVNGQAGSAGQGPDARDPGVCFVTQTPGTLASPKKVRNEIFFGTRSNRDLVCLKGQNSNFVLLSSTLLLYMTTKRKTYRARASVRSLVGENPIKAPLYRKQRY